MTASRLLPPSFWHGLLCALDAHVVLFPRGDDLCVENMDNNLPWQQDHHPNTDTPITQGLALWGGLEPLTRVLVTFDLHEDATTTPPRSFSDFAQGSFRGNIARLDMPDLHLLVGFHITNSIHVANTTPVSAHMRLQRAEVLAPLLHNKEWADSVLAPLRARSRGHNPSSAY